MHYAKDYLNPLKHNRIIYEKNLRQNRLIDLTRASKIRMLLKHSKGIPDNFLVKITEKGGSMEYVDPVNLKTSVRVMPGKPHSPNPLQHNTYVVEIREEWAISKSGNKVEADLAEAHIPIEEFIYRR